MLTGKVANGHSGSVKCIEKVDASGNVLASGGRDGKIVLYDLRLSA